LFCLDNFVFVGPGRLGLRRAQADCGPAAAASAAQEHASGNGGIREALDRRSRNAFESAKAEARQTGGDTCSGWVH